MGRPPSGAFLYRLRESGMDVLYGNGREFSHSIVLEGLYHIYIWYLVQFYHYIAAASSTYSAMGSASAGEAQVES